MRASVKYEEKDPLLVISLQNENPLRVGDYREAPVAEGEKGEVAAQLDELLVELAQL